MSHRQSYKMFFFLHARCNNKINHLCCSLFLWIEDVDDDNDDKILSWTKKCLMEGHVVAVPTDTIYGLACLAQNSEAIRKIYDIKGRNQQKPLAICVGQIQDIYKWVLVHLYAGFCSRIYFFKLLWGPVKKSEGVISHSFLPIQNTISTCYVLRFS